MCRRLRSAAENQCHPVARREPDKFSFRLRRAHLLRSADHFLQMFQKLALLINEQFGVAHDVDEEDMRDLEIDFFFNLGHGELLRRQIGDDFLEARIIA